MLPMQEMQETRVGSLDRENPLEEEVSTHWSILAWEIPWTEKPGGLQSMQSRKVRGTRDQIANICWIVEKAREFQKNMYFCFIDYAKAFDCAEYNKLWEILKEMEIPDHLTCLLRNLYAGWKQQLELDMEQQTGSK